MSIIVTGSIATDHLMNFPGKFSEQLLVEHLQKVSLSFLVDDLEIRRGGVAGNIGFAIGVLGGKPTLVGAVGADFAEYRSWLEDHGVNCDAVLISETAHTARFVCTTDQDMAQIASFYPGAMSEARDISLADVVSRTGTPELRSSGPTTLMPCSGTPRNAAAWVCRSRRIRRSSWPVCPENRRATSSVAPPTCSPMTTSGTCCCPRRDGPRPMCASASSCASPLSVPTVLRSWRRTALPQGGCGSGEGQVDPTGVGDAWRAGFLSARSAGLSLERSAQLGSLVATLVLETVGTQEWLWERDEALVRLADAYGQEAADEIGAAL